MLAKFKSKLLSQKKPEKDGAIANPLESWMVHKLACEKEEKPVLAKDANLRGEGEWYDLHDPRNPINLRKAAAAAAAESAKSRKK